MRIKRNDQFQRKTYIDQNGYYRFCDSDILVHRWVMEKKMGRPLKPWEVVHHKNRNKLNNRMDNLRLCESEEHHRNIHLKTLELSGRW